LEERAIAVMFSRTHRTYRCGALNGPRQDRDAHGCGICATARFEWLYIFGYARVSTRDQDLASQIAELQAAGCGNIFQEKASGAKTDRPELAKVIRRLEHGDVMVVTRLDRLARSTRDLLNILDAVAKAGAGFKSLKDTWADTTTPHGRLMLTVLGGLAEFERELIRARTDDGRRRAQARGVRFGRPLVLTAHQRQEAIHRLAGLVGYERKGCELSLENRDVRNEGLGHVRSSTVNGKRSCFISCNDSPPCGDSQLTSCRPDQ
jgi:DNA invertase Pin-like site-specific DNA recombinase